MQNDNNNNDNNNNNNNLCTILNMNDSEKTGMGHETVSRRLLKNCRKNTRLILLLFARRRYTIKIEEKMNEKLLIRYKHRQQKLLSSINYISITNSIV